MTAYEWLDQELRKLQDERRNDGREWWHIGLTDDDAEVKRIRKEYHKRLRRETWAGIWKLMWDADAKGLRRCYMLWWAGILIMAFKWLPWPHTNDLQESILSAANFLLIMPLLGYAVYDMHRLNKKWKAQEKEWREKYNKLNSSLGGDNGSE